MGGTMLGYKLHPTLQKAGLPAAVVAYLCSSSMEDFRIPLFNCTDSAFLSASHPEQKEVQI